jgi:hypothetical protein
MSGPTGGASAARLFGRPDAVVSSGKDMSNRTRTVARRIRAPGSTDDVFYNARLFYPCYLIVLLGFYHLHPTDSD